AILLTGAAQAADRTFTGSAPEPRKGAESWHYFLVLHDNTHAFFRTIRSSRSSMIETGIWTTNDAGHVAVQFLDRSGRPRGEPLVWRLADGVLTPVSWDKEEWGDSRPPTLKRG
ncbi:MAG TPA: hypothetical protein VHD61_13695, partial [Lacunisphaera sp.]|nr:hypothetical protein [Lacunisphaera sp.]